MQSRIAVIGVVLFAVLLTIFAFTRQQQASLNEATAVANARAAGTLQSEADTARETAIAQANDQATAQAQANSAASTAIAQAALAVNAQTDAEQAQATAIAQSDSRGTAQAEAEAEEATAVGAADIAMTAQAKAEATGAAAIETAQAGATEAREQAATAVAALTSSSRDADALASYQSQSTQNAAIGATEIAALQADATTGAEAAKTLVARIEATATAQLEMTATAYQELVTQIWETSRELDAQRTQTATAPTTVAVAGTPYPVPNLTQTFTYSDGSFSVRYPRRWIADELPDNVVTLSSSQQAGLVLFGTVKREIFISLGAYSKEEADGVPLDALIAGSGEAMDQAIGLDKKTLYTDPETFQLGDYEAIRIIGTNDTFDIEIIGYEKNEGIILLVGFCGAGEIALCEATLLAIAETVNYHAGQT